MRNILRARNFVLLHFFLSTGGILWLLVNYDTFCSQSPGRGTHKHPYPVNDDDDKAKRAELRDTEKRLKEERRALDILAVQLRRQYPQSAERVMKEGEKAVEGGGAGGEGAGEGEGGGGGVGGGGGGEGGGGGGILPTIFAITPTHTRPVQKAELTRLAQTFLHVPNFHWLVVEDADGRSGLVADFLGRSGLRFTHLSCRTPAPARLAKGDPNWLKPRGVEQRNTALDWLLENVDSDQQPGVVYFADDDNTYDLQVFEEMRYTQKVSMWPVGLVGGQMYENPRVDRNGKVTGWNVGWQPQRPFPMDMAGFAINLALWQARPGARFSLRAKRGYLESSLLQDLVTQEDLEPKADMCTKIYVWHTRTEKPKLKYDIKDSEVPMEV